MERLWQREGYSAPGANAYPWQWLWDSCFHSLVWCALGDARALIELETLFGLQHRDGMVPHIGYQRAPVAGVGLWGRPRASTITQPPMFGHALAELQAGGHDVAHLIDPATRALKFLLERRMLGAGLVGIVHPWESGCDDSPRWDRYCPGSFDRRRFAQVKATMVRSLELSADHSAVANPAFSVAPASFNALVAFNCAELARLTGDADLADGARSIADALDARFDAVARTWPDSTPRGEVASSVRTLEALLAVLVTSDASRAAEILADVATGAYAGPHGTRGVHPDEATYEPAGYWRGGAWPHLDYLFWLAARRRGLGATAAVLRDRSVAGALASRFSEYRDPETGAGLGATPQGWACLPAVMVQV